MRKLFAYYHPNLVKRVAYRSQLDGYDPEKFMEWVIHFADFSKNDTKTVLRASTNTKILLLYGYYFWVIYIICSLFIVLMNVFVGIGGVLISPFVTIGSMYAYVYVMWYLKYRSKQKSLTPSSRASTSKQRKKR